ncbi:MAG: PQQ-binding-like beta-propeller repeat protein [Spirochaetes bacterium]|nr:PQQ-binding-like beta-propeller repeat protein [Spirochaetota bacterium]
MVFQYLFKSIKPVLHIVLIILFSTSCSKKVNNVPQDTGWIQWRGPNSNGTITDEVFNADFIKKENPVVWRAFVGWGYSALAVSDNRVYTMGRKIATGSEIIEEVYCLDSSDGEVIWKFEFEQKTDYQYAGPRSMPVISGEHVIAVGGDGDVISLSVKDGSVRWKRNVAREENTLINEWGISGSPVIENGVIYLNIGGGVALNETDGSTIWKGDTTLANGYATPVLFDYEGKRNIMLFGGQHLLLIDAADGQEKARYEWINMYHINAADPVIIDNNKVLISSSYRDEGNALLDFSTGSFKEVWIKEGISTHFSSLIEHEGALFGINGDTNARARCTFTSLDPLTGEIYYQEKTGMYGSLIKVNNTLVYLTEHGYLHTVEPTTSGFSASEGLDVLSESGRGGSWVAPSYWNGYLYLRSNVGEIVCIKAH